VLHHPRSFFPLDLFQQVADTAELQWVVDSSTSDGSDLRLLSRLGTVVDIARLDHDAAAGALAAHQPEGIVTYVDDLVETAAALAERLGLRYHTPEVARVLVDKRLQRECLARAGLPGPAFWPVAAGLSRDAIADLADEVIYPVVLKPAEGSGSRDIQHVESADELRSVLEAETGQVGYLLEEYLVDGSGHESWTASYFSAESVVSAGRVSHVALTGRFPLAEPFRETGNFIPALLSPSTQSEAIELVNSAIKALGILDAVIHTEIKITPDGLRVIEVNGRLGGRPPFVLASVSNVNLFQVSCHIAAGLPVAFDDLVECDGVGFWLMLQPPMAAERVAAVGGLNGIAALDYVDIVNTNRSPGDCVSWKDGTESHVVSVRGWVGDHETLADVITRIHREVTIEYLP
jgi:biotin carboxylase